MEWIVIAIEFAIVTVSAAAVVALLGNALSINAPSLAGLLVRSTCTGLIFAGGMALWMLVPITIPYLGLVVPFVLLMTAGFACWGFEFPEETTYAACFAAVVWVARFALAMIVSWVLT